MNVYTVAIATRLKRRIFRAGILPSFFQENITVIFSKHDIRLRSIQFYDYGVVMEIESDDELKEADVSRMIRYGTSAVMRSEFSELWALPSLWTKHIYFQKGELDRAKVIEINRFYDSIKSR